MSLAMGSTVNSVTLVQAQAMAWSYLRVFLAASLALYLTLGRLPLDLTRGDLKAITNAGLAALALTVFNYLRTGDHRFGSGTDPVTALLATSRKVTPSVEDFDEPLALLETPVQTDNTPKDEDGRQLPLSESLGEFEWSGQEMR